MINYYQKKLFLAQVDKDDNIIGRVERWSAHEKGILHRGFTTILTYQNQFVLQHRKHPAFDKFWDLTFSSHQIFKNETLQTDLDAIYESLNREWNLKEKDLVAEPKFMGKFYYKANDPNSKFTEHEIDYIYCAELKKPPSPNPDYAYDFSLISKKEILNTKYLILNTNLCPWMKKIVNESLI